MSRLRETTPYDTFSLVSDRLFLTSVDAVARVDDLTALGVSHVLSVLTPEELPGPDWHARLAQAGIRQQTYALNDREDIHITDVLDQTRKELVRIHVESVLNVAVVHCQVGRSRSATCVLNYWLANNPRLSVDTALRQLRQRRTCVLPNWYFMKTLRDVYTSPGRSL